jgi:hypothetical protein
MSIQLPPPIALYVQLENAGDTATLSTCFAANAIVRDESRTYEGLAAITAWNRSSPQTRSVRSQLSNCLYCPRRSDWSFFFVDTRVPEREKTLGSVMSALCNKRAMASRGVGTQ